MNFFNKKKLLISVHNSSGKLISIFLQDMLLLKNDTLLKYFFMFHLNHVHEYHLYLLHLLTFLLPH